ncbi:MAG TPA: phosphate signaling complex protein PhoU [Candidatus Sumerlaeota bacterium]|nr:phosphate signaling complex protein PhoU [Candidatus Sumerlaeota bacterium]
MSAHLQHALNDLKKRILNLSARVEEAVQKATEAFETCNAPMAQEIINCDVLIDMAEVEIEEECLKILALHQPVAVDLRFIVAVLKINNDLERVGDLAVNIAERACFLATRTMPDVPFDFGYMATKVQKMLKDSMDAVVEMDIQKALEVCLADDEVDKMNALMYDLSRQKLTEPDVDAGCLLHMLSVSRHLERIADQATNIAEDAIYMVKGEIVRHKTEEYTR